MQHPEDPSLAEGGAATEGELATRLGLPGIPAAAEAILVARDIRLAALTGGAVHFAHVSTAEALSLIRQAKADGLAVTCDTAPPYFDLNETAIGDFRTYAKLSPPLRKEADRLAVVAALADGTIDAIASDHQPRDADDKRQPFAQATPGGTGLATLLGVTLAQVHNGALTLAQAIELLTARPATLLGVEAGRLAKGRPADLCLFHPERVWQVEAGGCPARRRTRRSTAARWRGSCWARGRPGGACSDDYFDHGLSRRRPARAKSSVLRRHHGQFMLRHRSCQQCAGVRVGVAGLLSFPREASASAPGSARSRAGCGCRTTSTARRPISQAPGTTALLRPVPPMR